MASTHTTRLGLEKQADGENSGTWGQRLNNSVIDLVDFAIAGLTSVALSSAPITLTDNDGTADQSRASILYLHGTLTSNCQVVVPSVTKPYSVYNACTGNFNPVIKTAGGAGSPVPRSGLSTVFCDSVSVWIDRTSIGNSIIMNGAVTSVGVSAGAGVSVTGGPITSSGSLAIILDVNKLTEDTSPSFTNDYLVTYHASAAAPRKVKPRNIIGDYFVATKGDADQAGILNADETKMTFSTEEYDTAGVYDTATSRFVPPNGEAWMLSAKAQTTDGSDAMYTYLNIKKNGVTFRTGSIHQSGGPILNGPAINIIVVGNGTDYYEVYFGLSNSLANRTVEGDVTATYFQGHRIG